MKTKSHKTPNTTDGIYIQFSKFFTDYIKNTSQKFTKSKFNINQQSIYLSYLSIQELTVTQGDSHFQTSRHTAVRQEKFIFSKFSNTIREKLTSN